MIVFLLFLSSFSAHASFRSQDIDCNRILSEQPFADAWFERAREVYGRLLEEKRTAVRSNPLLADSFDSALKSIRAEYAVRSAQNIEEVERVFSALESQSQLEIVLNSLEAELKIEEAKEPSANASLFVLTDADLTLGNPVFSPDSRLVAYVSPTAVLVRSTRTAQREVLFTITHNAYEGVSQAAQLIFSPDSRFLAIVGTQFVSIYDVSQRQAKQLWEAERRFGSYAKWVRTSDGNFVFIHEGSDANFKMRWAMWSEKTGQIPVAENRLFQKMVVSADGSRFSIQKRSAKLNEFYRVEVIATGDARSHYDLVITQEESIPHPPPQAKYQGKQVDFHRVDPGVGSADLSLFVMYSGEVNLGERYPKVYHRPVDASGRATGELTVFNHRLFQEFLESVPYGVSASSSDFKIDTRVLEKSRVVVFHKKIAGPKGEVGVFDYETGELLWKDAGNILFIDHDRGGKSLFVADKEKVRIFPDVRKNEWYYSQNRDLEKLYNLRSAVSPDGRMILFHQPIIKDKYAGPEEIRTIYFQLLEPNS